jgi:hypothetical protein
VKGTIVFLVLIAAAAGAIAWYLGYFPNHVNDLTLVSIEPIHPDDSRNNLRLRFSSRQNLRTLVDRSGSFGAFADVSFCPWRPNPYLSTARVKHHGLDLGTNPGEICWHKHWPELQRCRSVNDFVKADRADGRFLYEIDFGYSEQWLTYKDTFGGTTWRRFPLPSHLHDVCVNIHGYDDPPGFQGNIIVIPKAALEKALHGSTPQPLDQKKWSDDPSQLDCSPRSFRSGQKLALKFGVDHGTELAIHRLIDNTWWILISSDAPAADNSLMTERAFSETRGFSLPSDATGFRWWTADSPQQRIFAKSGDYVVYVVPPGAENIETDKPGFGCLIHYAAN